MRALFVHQNFPGQYRHVAPALAAQGHAVVALGMNEAPALPGVNALRYGIKAHPTEGIHPLARNFETKVLRGEAAARAGLALKAQGFSPDVICGHPGWGETLFLKDVWPAARMLGFAEFHYRLAGADVGFDPEFPMDGEASRFEVTVKNAPHLLAYDQADWLVSPTRWQAGQVPPAYREKVSVIHDGIDTGVASPNPSATIRLNTEGPTLSPGDEVVTFVSRNLEPYRGYHIFMRALPEILRRRPKARVIIVGGNGTSYGRPRADGRSHRDAYLDEVKDALDLSRVHFVGRIPHAVFLNLLQVSAAHVYLTYPFVLSWSLIEAMAVGCAVVGSATPPVEELVRHGENGLLVDFFSPGAIAEAVVALLADPQGHRGLRAAARRTALGYDLASVCLPRHLQLIGDVAAGRRPAAV
ncbi:glycosyltransferase family 4 protein [Methylobacterium sp. Leaf466]|uniref:glycosyltransferase family 4 protein n=1 Tax=Methylobacterium sp. Leaf466 TaxID=1736386 RepID=UPI0006FCD223|nr:glycosyltransferase family 4 protein [Methylobacterium sp. Leaf466]KQT90527.1 glycosyl transferase family 1 [Methylobacterium sp. Leaf466]